MINIVPISKDKERLIATETVFKKDSFIKYNALYVGSSSPSSQKAKRALPRCSRVYKGMKDECAECATSKAALLYFNMSHTL